MEHPPKDVGELAGHFLCLGCLGLLGFLLALFSTIGWFQLFFPKTFDLNLKSGVCRFRSIPGFRKVVFLDAIDSIVLCKVAGNWAYLCFAIQGWKRYLPIHGVPIKDENPKSFSRDLELVAEELSELLDCPIERHGMVRWYRLRIH